MVDDEDVLVLQIKVAALEMLLLRDDVMREEYRRLVDLEMLRAMNERQAPGNIH